MNIFDQVSYFMTSFLALAAGIMVYARRPREPEVKAFGAFMLSLVGWIVTLHFYYLLADTSGVILAGRLNGAFVELVILFSLVFIYYFTGKRKISEWLLWFVPLSVVILVGLTLGTDMIDENEFVRGVGRLSSHGPLYYSMIIYMASLLAAGIVLLAQKIRASAGAARQQLVAFAAAWIIGLSLAIFTNLALPELTGNQEWSRLGPYAALFFVLLFGYAVARHELFNITLLAAEVMVFALVLLFVLNFSLSISPLNQVVAAVSAVLGIILGYLLIRSFRRECVQRSEVQGLADQLLEANKNLQEMSEAKSEFISIASHQLRTPVSVIKGYLSMILEGTYGSTPGVIREKLEQLAEMNERLVILINNLLNVARIEKDDLEFDCRESDIVGIIRQTIAQMSLNKLKERQLRIVFREPTPPPTPVYVDVIKLTEVLINLIDNAIKYTDKGSIEISVEDSTKDDSIIIRVKDTGIGMKSDDIAHVFEKFFRPSRPNGQRQAGMSMGIGLYICSKFLHSMGGNIWVESTAPGQGTTMAVSLPKRPAAVCAVDQAGRYSTGVGPEHA